MVWYGLICSLMYWRIAAKSCWRSHLSAINWISFSCDLSLTYSICSLMMTKSICLDIKDWERVLGESVRECGRECGWKLVRSTWERDLFRQWVFEKFKSSLRVWVHTYLQMSIQQRRESPLAVDIPLLHIWRVLWSFSVWWICLICPITAMRSRVMIPKGRERGRESVCVCNLQTGTFATTTRNSQIDHPCGNRHCGQWSLCADHCSTPLLSFRWQQRLSMEFGFSTLSALTEFH